MLNIQVRTRGLKRALQAMEELKKPVLRSDLSRLGRAGVSDARRSIREGRSPSGEPWRRTKDGGQAYAGSLSLQRSVVARILVNETVRIGSDDVRAALSHSARRGGSRIRLRKEALVPLSRAIERRKAAAGGWSGLRGFKIKSRSGSTFLVERPAGSRQLVFLGVFKRFLKHYRREFLGVGPLLRREADALGFRVVARVERIGER